MATSNAKAYNQFLNSIKKKKRKNKTRIRKNEDKIIEAEKNMSHRIEVAEELGDRKVIPIKDIEVLRKLENISDSFWVEYEKVPISYITSGMVDGEPVLIVLVHLIKSTPVNLPGKFQGYRVLIDYGEIEPAHQTYHEVLEPGISISGAADSACTLGPLFRTDYDDKRYFLTVEHGIKGDNLVIQPGRADQGSVPCATVRYSYFGVDQNSRLLDYAFCEIHDQRRSIHRNIPFGTPDKIIINEFSNNPGSSDNMFPVMKVGRSTACTNGTLWDRWRMFMQWKLGVAVKALTVRGDEIRFGVGGDSGSPVFEDNGVLWGIIYGNYPNQYVNEIAIIPIHLILEDAERRFNRRFSLV